MWSLSAADSIVQGVGEAPCWEYCENTKADAPITEPGLLSLLSLQPYFQEFSNFKTVSFGFVELFGGCYYSGHSGDHSKKEYYSVVKPWREEFMP